MGYTAQSGQIIIGKQSAFETPVPDAELLTNGLGLRVRSGSLAGNRDLLTTDPEIGGGRDTTDAYLGGVVFEGEYDMYARLNTLPFFFEAALGIGSGSSAPGTASGTFVHTITPTDGQLSFYTVYEEISSNLARFKYTDAVANTLHLEADANGFLTMTSSLIARLATPNTPDVEAAGVLDNTSLIVGSNTVIKYDGVTLPAKSFSLDIGNNVENDNFYMGSLFVGDLTAKSREVTASATLRHETADYMRQALLGSATGNAFGGITTKKALTIECESYEDIPGAAAGSKYKIVITLPTVAFEPFAFEPSGDDALENEVSMRALRPVVTTPIMTVEITNGRETISAAP